MRIYKVTPELLKKINCSNSIIINLTIRNRRAFSKSKDSMTFYRFLEKGEKAQDSLL